MEFIFYGIITPPLIESETFIGIVWDILWALIGAGILEIIYLMKKLK